MRRGEWKKRGRRESKRGRRGEGGAKEIGERTQEEEKIS